MNPSDSPASAAEKNAYFDFRAILAAALALGIVAFALPHTATAFWSLFPFARSAEAQSLARAVPDPSLRLLAAATNADPNPEKGGCALPTSEGAALTGKSCPDAAYVEGASHGGSISLYVVREGDTLSEIADMFDVSINTILWANDLKGPTGIHPGDSLVILPVTGIRHKIGAGDTLASLAKEYGGDAGEIASYNGIAAGSALTVGESIIIPHGEVRVAAKPAAAGSGAKPAAKQGGGLSSIAARGSGVAMPGFFRNPVPGAIITQGVHGWNGVDLAAPLGTPIVAAAGGTVIVSRASGWNGGYGNYVVIDHGNGAQTLYSHLSTVIASAGASISKGEPVGTVGKTGEATGYHLHFEVRGAKNPLAGCALMSACSAE